MKNSMNKKKKIALTVSAAIVLGFTLPGLYNGIKLRCYSLNSDKINSKIRIALISDLHSCRYGKDEHKLLEAIDGQNPDLVFMSGDIFDDKKSDANTEKFIAGVSKKYPCYYVTGNHEYKSGEQAFNDKMSMLGMYGVVRLSGEAVTLNVNGDEINICGIDDPLSLDYPFENTLNVETQLDNIKPIMDNGKFSILISHRPELISTYAEYGFDLALCGHAHGGQIRIPGVLNGLFSTCEGFFPKYAGGMFSENGMTQIVSRGLARETTVVPRFYNRPEVVIIDIS